MSMNCEKFTYAQNTVKPKSSLPMSWKCSTLSTSLSRPSSLSAIVTRMSVAKIATTEPEKMVTPKIVEYHPGFSDISQSNAAKVRLRPKRMVAPGAKRCAATVSFGSFDASCDVEKPNRRVTRNIQIAK